MSLLEKFEQQRKTWYLYEEAKNRKSKKWLEYWAQFLKWARQTGECTPTRIDERIEEIKREIQKTTENFELI